MRCFILGLLAGILLLQTQAILPSFAILGWLGGAMGVLVALAQWGRQPLLRMLLLGACGACAGFVWAALFAQHHLAQALPTQWEGRDVTVIGTIDNLPNRFEQGVRFNFAVEKVLPVDGILPPIPSTLALSWYSAFRMEELQAIGDVQPGERWQLTVRLQRPHGNANPEGFDYEVWLLEQNLRATGYVRPDTTLALKNLRQDKFVWRPGHVVETSRGWLRDRILSALPDKKYAGVIVALVVGDQRAVSQSDWTVFNRTGVGHLISISGLHITMVAGLFANLMFGLWRRSFFTRAQLPLLLPAQKVAALAGAGIALLYVLLAGFGVPAQRTLYMLSVVAVALWCGRLASVSHVLCAALAAVLVLDPWAVLWPGFWLSFGAVAVILYATVGRVRAAPAPDASRWQRIRAALQPAAHVQYVVTLGLVPLTMLLFGQISLVSPVANAIAIPLVSFVVTPLALLGSVLPTPLSGWVLHAAHWVVQWLAGGLTWLSDFPAAVWLAPLPSWPIFLSCLLGALWMLTPRGWPLRWIGTVGWIPLLLNVPSHPEPGEWVVTAFDVGQGMALLIETEHHRLLYDTGPSYSPESNGGNRVVLPYLKARGISKLDGVIVSHSDADHSGGALSIFDEIAIDWVASSLPMEHKIVVAAPHHRRCVAGQAWEWDGVLFEMLHPTSVSYTSTKWKPNARGCTLKITRDTQSMLLPADIEAVQEAELLESMPEKLRATVLLAPHHGSGTSSTVSFLTAVKPEVALFQVGYRNRYHHPKQEVFARYGELGIQRVRTDESGAIALQFGSGLELIEYRTVHARYWYGR